jgi:hypothetical protein
MNLCNTSDLLVRQRQAKEIRILQQGKTPQGRLDLDFACKRKARAQFHSSSLLNVSVETH